MRKTKRPLSFLLAVLMIVSIFAAVPFTASAATLRYRISITSGSQSGYISQNTALPYVTTTVDLLRRLGKKIDQDYESVDSFTHKSGSYITSLSPSQMSINTIGTETILLKLNKIGGGTMNGEFTITVSPLTEPIVTAGKYLRMGSYNGVNVDWYCQRLNGTGYMMLCKYGLKKDTFGSNATYSESNVHAWLDLDSGGTFATDLGLKSYELGLVNTVNLKDSAGDGTDSFIIPAYGNDELNKDTTVYAPYNINDPSSLLNVYWLRTPRDASNARVINHSKDGSPVATVAARYSGVGNSQWIRPMF